MSKTESQLGQYPGATGIGSLPHHNIDSALAFSFQTDIPFLPQIPMRNAWEFMIAQALEGMPGLMVDGDGSCRLDLDVWTGRCHAFNERLLQAFAMAAHPQAFAAFEPSAAASSSWQPFLWELEERNVKLAKLQIAGPLTSQWVLQLKDGTAADHHEDISDQVYRLVPARSLAMCRRLQADGIQPLFYLDEPGLFGLSLQNPRHVMGLQQLKLVVQALKKEGVIVGLHCCSDTQWPQLLGLGLDVLSLDADLSLKSVLQHHAAVMSFLEAGGRFSFGVIPTPPQTRIDSLSGKALLAQLVEQLELHWPQQKTLVRKVLSEAIYTPACGLALHSTSDAEAILGALMEFSRAVADVDASVNRGA